MTTSAPVSATRRLAAGDGRDVHPRRDPAWWRPGLVVVGALAALLRVLGAPGGTDVGNTYYAAVAMSMAQTPTAFVTGAVDGAGFITMDKPAVWLWPSAVLVALFGANWVTLFLPQVIAGTLAVVMLAAAVREGTGGAGGTRGRCAAALLAALGLAISPITVAVDRVNSPDAIMMMFLVAAAWATLRATRRDHTGALVVAGLAAALAFDAKYFQAFLVLPALAAAYLVGSAVRGVGLGRRVRNLAVAAGACLVTSAAWPVLAWAVSEPGRPWFGSSPDGTLPGRLLGVIDTHVLPPAVPDGPMGAVLAAFSTGEVFHAGQPGPTRLFTGTLADQVSWWLPASAVAVLVCVLLRRLLRSGPTVEALVLWSTWLLSVGLVFSFMPGVLHPYYTGMLVPAAAALVGGAVVAAWTTARTAPPAGVAALAALTTAGGGWALVVLSTSDAVRPSWLAWSIALVGGVAVVVAAATVLRRRVLRGTGAAVLAVGLAVAILGAPVVWTARTTAQPLLGINPLANQEGRYLPAVLPPPLGAAFLAPNTEAADPALVRFLQDQQRGEQWIAATWTVMEAAPLIVGTGGRPVLALGGFTGTDPTPTPEQFRELVRTGAVRFVLTAGPGGFANVSDGPAARTMRWSEQSCVPTTVPGSRSRLSVLDCRAVG